MVCTLLVCGTVTVAVFTSQVAVESAEFAYALIDRVHDVLGDGASFDRSRASLLHLVQAVKSDGKVPVAAAGPMSDSDKLISIVSLMYASGGRNDTAGFRKAVQGLQSIFKFEDELLESLVALDFRFCGKVVIFLLI